VFTVPAFFGEFLLVPVEFVFCMVWFVFGGIVIWLPSPRVLVVAPAETSFDVVFVPWVVVVVVCVGPDIRVPFEERTEPSGKATVPSVRVTVPSGFITPPVAPNCPSGRTVVAGTPPSKKRDPFAPDRSRSVLRDEPVLE
jgi:hypothetical protein